MLVRTLGAVLSILESIAWRAPSQIPSRTYVRFREWDCLDGVLHNLRQNHAHEEVGPGRRCCDWCRLWNSNTNRLNGTIPSQIGLMTSLRHVLRAVLLEVYHSFKLAPVAHGHLMKKKKSFSVFALSCFRSLELSGNSHVGTIPGSIGLCTLLRSD